MQRIEASYEASNLDRRTRRVAEAHPRNLSRIDHRDLSDRDTVYTGRVYSWGAGSKTKNNVCMLRWPDWDEGRSWVVEPTGGSTSAKSLINVAVFVTTNHERASHSKVDENVGRFVELKPQVLAVTAKLPQHMTYADTSLEQVQPQPAFEKLVHKLRGMFRIGCGLNVHPSIALT